MPETVGRNDREARERSKDGSERDGVPLQHLPVEWIGQRLRLLPGQPAIKPAADQNQEPYNASSYGDSSRPLESAQLLCILHTGSRLNDH